MVKLKLKFEPVLDKNGNEIGQGDEARYKQCDLFVLRLLLGLFDSTKYEVKDYEVYLSITDKIDLVAENTPRIDEIDLSIDEAALLKDFLGNIKTKSRKEDGREMPLDRTMLRTFVDIYNQLKS